MDEWKGLGFSNRSAWAKWKREQERDIKKRNRLAKWIAFLTIFFTLVYLLKYTGVAPWIN